VLKLVATDLDGTLLGQDGVVTARTRQVLDKLDARGVTVVFVTGRPIRWMDHLWEHVGGHGLAILSNGGAVLDVRTEEVVRHRPLPREVGLEVARRIREAMPDTTFALERLDGFAKEPMFLPQEDDSTNALLDVGPLDEVYADDVVKLLALDLAVEAESFWHRVEELVGDLVTTTWSSGMPLIEMSAAGVTKATTLAMLCEERGIAAHEVVAFGDMPNDVDMLVWAGTSYAMANAHPSVLEVATHVAPRHDEDGVAAVLTELFDL
jgi:hypothetical protein